MVPDREILGTDPGRARRGHPIQEQINGLKRRMRTCSVHTPSSPCLPFQNPGSPLNLIFHKTSVNPFSLWIHQTILKLSLETTTTQRYNFNFNLHSTWFQFQYCIQFEFNFKFLFPLNFNSNLISIKEDTNQHCATYQQGSFLRWQPCTSVHRSVAAHRLGPPPWPPPSLWRSAAASLNPPPGQ